MEQLCDKTFDELKKQYETKLLANKPNPPKPVKDDKPASQTPAPQQSPPPSLPTTTIPPQSPQTVNPEAKPEQPPENEKPKEAVESTGTPSKS